MSEIERLIDIIDRQQKLIDSLVNELIARDGGFLVPEVPQAREPGYGKVPWNKAKTELERRYSRKYSYIGTENKGANDHASQERQTVPLHADGSTQPGESDNWESALADSSEGVYIQDSSGQEEDFCQESEKE